MKQLELIINDRYQLTRKIGAGGFGLVYEGIDLDNGGEIAIKLENASFDSSLLESEFRVYKSLDRISGIPRALWYGQDCDYNVMVMEVLGPSLEDLFNYCGRRFSLKTVLMLADQLLSRLRSIHARDMVHRDIKPEHFLMGTGRWGNCVYVADFGLAWSSDAATAQRSRGMMGTALFASVKGHTGEEQTDTDDLESLGYMLLYFLRGSLPWQSLDYRGKEQEREAILGMKRKITIEELCKGTPIEIAEYFGTLREQSSSRRCFVHRRLQSKLQALFRSVRYEYDNVFDWTILKYQSSSRSDTGIKT